MPAAQLTSLRALNHEELLERLQQRQTDAPPAEASPTLRADLSSSHPTIKRRGYLKREPSLSGLFSTTPGPVSIDTLRLDVLGVSCLKASDLRRLSPNAVHIVPITKGEVATNIEYLEELAEAKFAKEHAAAVEAQRRLAEARRRAAAEAALEEEDEAAKKPSAKARPSATRKHAVQKPKQVVKLPQPPAPVSYEVQLNYIGWYIPVDATDNDPPKWFDSTLSRGTPFCFPTGEGAVFPGLEEAVRLLDVGARALCYIPPSLGFGDRPNAVVPPKAWMVLYVHLAKRSAAWAAPPTKDANSQLRALDAKFRRLLQPIQDGQVTRRKPRRESEARDAEDRTLDPHQAFRDKLEPEVSDRVIDRIGLARFQREHARPEPEPVKTPPRVNRAAAALEAAQSASNRRRRL